ncbi:hypothetical protein [Halostella litorea]|uniref:hypothetical protein n=1 Tax=Halostella litorea TaxID=2528831 RepID=UPI001092F97D|nr:hypothetical protein [Halostella litorea]
MSRPSPFHNERPSAETGDERNGRAGRLANAGLATPVRMVSFWAAVALPFLHVPLLATGLTTPSETTTFLALLGLNLVALLLGHSYNAE